MTITLREARIIIPLKTNDGVSLGDEIRWLGKRLTMKFGGYTQFTLAKGGWEGDNGKWIEELVQVFDVAVPDTEASCKYLTMLCKWLRRTCYQESIYLRLPTGEVLLVE
jgi:hypothetical protein